MMSYFKLGEAVCIIFVLVQVFTIHDVLAARKLELSETDNVATGNINKRSPSNTASSLKLGKNADLESEDFILTAQGNKRTKFTETYKGRKVFNSGVDVEEDDDGDKVVTGDVYTDLEDDLGDDTDCDLPKSEGKKILLKHFNLRKREINIVNQQYFDFIFVDENGKACWAKEVMLAILNSKGEFSRPTVFIDICTKEVVDSFDQTGLYTVPPTGGYTDDGGSSFTNNGDVFATDFPSSGDDYTGGPATDSPDSWDDDNDNDGGNDDAGDDDTGGPATDSPDSGGDDGGSGGNDGGSGDNDGGSGGNDGDGDDDDQDGGSDGDNGGGDDGGSAKVNCDIVDKAGNPKRVVLFGNGNFCLGPMRRSNDKKTCFLENKYVKTVDLKNKEDEQKTKIASFPCSEGYDDETNGGFSPVLDVFFFTSASMRFYREWYDYDPMKGQIPYAKAHYGVNYDNAYWDGTNMVFGDGDGVTTYPLTGLDTVAHELGHGVIEKGSNLAYRDQSGGMNEAFADMVGEATEAFLFGKSDWLSGVEMFVQKGQALRYFKDPTKDGSSIGHARDYDRGMDVHYSSGVYNRAFYLLSQKFGIKDAFKCFLIANRLYWRPNSDFEKGACGVLRAAYDGGYPMEEIVSVFKVVGIKMDGCKNPASLITAELKPGKTQTRLMVSDLVQPLFSINVPDGSNSLTVSTAGGLHVALTSSFERDAPVLAQGSGTVSHTLGSSGGTIYARFFRRTSVLVSDGTASLKFD